MRRSKLFIAILIAILITACDSRVVYDRYDDTPVAGWNKADSLHFDILPVDTTGTYNMEGGLRINGAFPFMSITLIVSTTIPNRHITQNDTIICPTINKTGKPVGQGVNFYQTRFPIKELQLEKGDSLHVTIRHNMRREELPGVINVGIKLEHND